MKEKLFLRKNKEIIIYIISQLPKYKILLSLISHLKEFKNDLNIYYHLKPETLVYNIKLDINSDQFSIYYQNNPLYLRFSETNGYTFPYSNYKVCPFEPVDIRFMFD